MEDLHRRGRVAGIQLLAYELVRHAVIVPLDFGRNNRCCVHEMRRERRSLAVNRKCAFPVSDDNCYGIQQLTREMTANRTVHQPSQASMRNRETAP
jgi:hypothetical protein